MFERIFLLVLISLGVLAYIFPPDDIQPAHHLLVYSLVGFAGAMLYAVVDPLKGQIFRLKGVINLGGAVAVAAAFMWLAAQVTPETRCNVQIRPYQSATWTGRGPHTESLGPALECVKVSEQKNGGGATCRVTRANDVWQMELFNPTTKESINCSAACVERSCGAK